MSKKRREESILEKLEKGDRQGRENERKREGVRGMGDDREIERERCGGG